MGSVPASGTPAPAVPPAHGGAPANERADALARFRYAVFVPPGNCGLGVSDVLEYYDRIRAYVTHEDDLTNTRLTWSLTTQGFLFAAFGFVLGKLLDFVGQPAKLSAPPLERLLRYMVGFEVVVACVGIAVGLCAFWAVLASHNAIQALQAIAHFHGPLTVPERAPDTVPRGALLMPHVIGGGAGRLRTFGGNFQWLLPLLIALAWAAILGLLVFLWSSRAWVFGPAAMG